LERKIWHCIKVAKNGKTSLPKMATFEDTFISVFQQNGYPFHFIRKALRQRSNPTPEPRATISIPYVKGVSEKIKRICAKERIYVYFSSSRTIGSFLNRVRPHTDPNDITGVIYRIPCQDCDHSYVGETGRTLRTRLSEHRRNCRNGEVERSGVAQHTIEEDHRIDWEGSTVINREKNWFKRRVKEALLIRKHPNFNQDQGLDISPMWNNDITRLSSIPVTR